MTLELESASCFLGHLVQLGKTTLGPHQLECFQNAVKKVLRQRFRDHWFPEKPYTGCGYRCIRITPASLDPLIVQAAVGSGLSPQFIHSLFPSQLTLWIDPQEVSYRIGESGPLCVLFTGGNPPWKPRVQDVRKVDLTGRKVDHLLDPQTPVSVEQIARFVD